MGANGIRALSDGFAYVPRLKFLYLGSIDFNLNMNILDVCLFE